jgi:hypothetical protein
MPDLTGGFELFEMLPTPHSGEQAVHINSLNQPEKRL